MDNFNVSNLNLNMSYGLCVVYTDNEAYENRVVLSNYFKPESTSSEVILRFSGFYISVTGRKIDFICLKRFKKKQFIKYIINSESIITEFDVVCSDFDLKSLERVKDLPSFLTERDKGIEIKLNLYFCEQ